MFIRFICRLVLVLTLAISLSVAPAVAGVLKVGDVLPADLKVMTEDESKIALASLVKSEPSMIVFFNTSCRSCLQEIRWLFKEYPERNKILISIDITGTRTIDRWKMTYMSKNPDVKVYFDPDFQIPTAFGLSSTPSSVLLDSDGTIIDVLLGYSPNTEAAVKDFFK